MKFSDGAPSSPPGDAVAVGYRPESVYLERTFTSLIKHAFKRTQQRPSAAAAVVGTVTEKADQSPSYSHSHHPRGVLHHVPSSSEEGRFSLTFLFRDRN